MADARTALPRTLRVIEQGMADGLHIGAQLYVSRRRSSASRTLRIGEPHGRGSDAVRLPHALDVVGEAGDGRRHRAAVGARAWSGSTIPCAGTFPSSARKGKEAITLRHVLTHTGGFRLARSAVERRHRGTRSSPRSVTPSSKQVGIPGQHAGYHVSSGWYILGEVVRRLDGRPFDRYVREAIFEPLGMHDSWVGMPAGPTQ